MFPGLATLGLSVGDLSPVIDDLDVLEPFDLHDNGDYIKKLVRRDLGLILGSGRQKLKSYRPSLHVFRSSKSSVSEIDHINLIVSVHERGSFDIAKLLSSSLANWPNTIRKFSCSISNRVGASKFQGRTTKTARTITDIPGQDTRTEGVPSLQMCMDPSES
jgi:hypothetical protein